LVLFLIFSVVIAQVDPNVPYFFRVGNVDIWRVQDSSRIASIISVFPNLTPSDFNGLVDPNGNPYVSQDGNFIPSFSYSGTLLHSMGKWILVDDGMGSLVNSNQPYRLPQLIQFAGVALTDIHYVLLTHFHKDHTGWNVDALSIPSNAIEFPNAKYISQCEEIHYWNSTTALQNTANWQNLFAPLIRAHLLECVTGPVSITDEISLMPCRGHTPGHQCILINSEGQMGIIVGDSFHRSVQVQRPDWSPVFDWDPTLAEPVRVNLVKMMWNQKITMIASHFAYPGVGQIEIDQHPTPKSSGWVFAPVNTH